MTGTTYQSVKTLNGRLYFVVLKARLRKNRKNEPTKRSFAFFFLFVEVCCVSIGHTGLENDTGDISNRIVQRGTFSAIGMNSDANVRGGETKIANFSKYATL